MKKILTVAITFVMVVMVAISANATTSSEIADTLYAKGKKYGMTSADRVKIERYIADNEISEEQANKVIALADEAVAVMEDAGVTSYSELTAAQQSSMKNLANEAADVLGLTLKFSTSKVEVYKGTKLVTSVTNDNGKLKYTGNSSAVIVASSLAIIALVAIVAKKRLSVEG